MIDFGADMVRLHIGDSYLQPVYPLPIEPGFIGKYSSFHRYCDTFGVEELKEVLVEKVINDNCLEINTSSILVTAGATNALSAAVNVLLNPGEDILMLTPCWPIFPGILHSAGINIIDTPFYTRLYGDPDLNIAAYLSNFLTPETAAVYLNSPNNPSGKVLTRGQLEQIATFCKQNKLWIISDEAYDGLIFDGLQHHSIGSFPGLFSQTISVFTFSKIFMFAGLRLGYAVAEQGVISHLNKIMVHQIYSPPALTQQMMISAVITRHQWMHQVCAAYQQMRDDFLSQLDLPVTRPQATYFIFFSLEPYLRGRSYEQLIDDFLNHGVSVAPGLDFGQDYSKYIRLCFTGESPAQVTKGIERLKAVLYQE